ncbi:MAG: hypothetical protein IJ460_07755 [Clostridia bacterium]|nr:hypothetical protein [Clostridia bacterium]
MNTIKDMIFKRKFSVNLYKNKKLSLAEMSFNKDWISTDRGDPYPLLSKSGDICESTEGNVYTISSAGKGGIKRLICQHFPYATYEITAEDMSEEAMLGICIDTNEKPDSRTISVYIKKSRGRIMLYRNICGEEAPVNGEIFDYIPGMSLVVTTHHGSQFDLYLRYGRQLKKAGYFNETGFENLKNERIFRSSTASVYAGFEEKGTITVSKAEMYIDCGMSQADMRPIRYEDGRPIIENGRIFLTMTSRLEWQKYQTVYSWNPSTCDFALEGAIFFDMGDGEWCGDVASSIIYDRNEGNWKIWMCAFSHGHVLGHAVTENDPRFGINVIDIELMETKEGSTDTDFAAKINDEDPDMYYDAEDKKWYMSICRSDSEDNDSHYSYFLFESDKPFEGYRFISKTSGDAVTGGSFIKTGKKRFFACGANFDQRAQYNIYDGKDFTKAERIKCDFDDGGFRGWGTVIPVPCGTRTKYMWITFDRHNSSEIYNWSYGNLYVYEADVMNKGYEW